MREKSHAVTAHAKKSRAWDLANFSISFPSSRRCEDKNFFPSSFILSLLLVSIKFSCPSFSPSLLFQLLPFLLAFLYHIFFSIFYVFAFIFSSSLRASLFYEHLSLTRLFFIFSHRLIIQSII